MENTREEEEEKLHYTTLNYKMKKKNYPKPCISSTLDPKGVFIGTRGTGGQGTNPGPKRGRGHTGAARAALQVARGPVCLLPVPVPGFWFTAPGFDESALLGQWL